MTIPNKNIDLSSESATCKISLDLLSAILSPIWQPTEKTFFLVRSLPVYEYA